MMPTASKLLGIVLGSWNETRSKTPAQHLPEATTDARVKRPDQAGSLRLPDFKSSTNETL